MRDDLSHNVFLMLQECNKFREHQARELLIELLEQQLAERKSLTGELRKSIERADELLIGDAKQEETKVESGKLPAEAAPVKEEAT